MIKRNKYQINWYQVVVALLVMAIFAIGLWLNNTYVYAFSLFMCFILLTIEIRRA